MTASDPEALDIDAPLGDASEVYETIATGETHADVDTPYANFDTGGGPGEVFVDDISPRGVFLVSRFKTDDARFGVLSKLDPDDARRLAYALLRSADYVDEMRGDSE